MTAPVDVLVNELKALRRGRGMQAPALDRTVGPQLRRLCDIRDGDGAGVVRSKVTAWVNSLIQSFPDDLRLAVTTTFAMNPAAQHKFHSDRVSWLAEQADRDARTMRRRIDDALIRLAEAALTPAVLVPTVPAVPAEQPRWHFKRFNALLRLDGPTPVCHEQRTIVANSDGIDRIPWSISLPKSAPDSPADLDVEVLQGAVFSGMDRPSSRRFLLNLRLPEPLRTGQTHEFALAVRVPRGQAMRPTYVYWPERRCELFSLVIRFAPHALPRAVWRVRDVFHRDADDLDPGPDRLEVNSVGEVKVTFTDPQPGRGHGVQWLPA